MLLSERGVVMLLSARGVVCLHCQRGVWCVYIVSEGCGVYTLSARGVVCIRRQRGLWCVYDVSEVCGVIRRQRGLWCVYDVSEGCGVIRRQQGVWCDTTSARGVCRILRPVAEAQAVFRTQGELRGYTERYRQLDSMLPDVGFTPTVRSVLFVVCCFHCMLCLCWLQQVQLRTHGCACCVVYVACCVV